MLSAMVAASREAPIAATLKNFATKVQNALLATEVVFLSMTTVVIMKATRTAQAQRRVQIALSGDAFP